MLGRDPVLLGMSGLRLLSGLIEVSAALLMFYFGTVQRAVVINSLLALVGPFVLVAVTTLGLWGMADQLHVGRIALVGCGVALILVAVRG